MKHIRYIALLMLMVSSVCFGKGAYYYAGQEVSGGDYCSGISWPTLSDFTLDFDSTEDEKNACVSGGTETGALTNATVAAPATVSPVSGGDALLADGNDHYIAFDNTIPYFRSLYGELYLDINLTDNNTGSDYYLRIFGTQSQDEIRTYVGANGIVIVYWEDNNGTPISLTLLDLDSYYGDWAQIHIKWDTTRCTDGDGNCNDANEDEFCARYRVDDNRDGVFESWSSYVCETSTDDLAVWASEPSSDGILFGLIGSTYSQNIYVDDLEISYDQPSW